MTQIGLVPMQCAHLPTPVHSVQQFTPPSPFLLGHIWTRWIGRLAGSAGPARLGGAESQTVPGTVAPALAWPAGRRQRVLVKVLGVSGVFGKMQADIFVTTSMPACLCLGFLFAAEHDTCRQPHRVPKFPLLFPLVPLPWWHDSLVLERVRRSCQLVIALTVITRRRCDPPNLGTYLVL